MESSAHWKAKYRLKEILENTGYTNIQIESKQAEITIEFLGKRTYIFDVQAEDEQGWLYCFEVDGKKGHTSRRNIAKDRTRDRAMLENGIRTVRIQTIDLVGKKKQTDQEIIQEIEYQLKECEKLDVVSVVER